MLVKKEDRMEIWSEGWHKGLTILVTILGIFAIVFVIIGIMGCMEGNVLRGLIIATVMPALYIFIGVKMYSADKEKYLMLAVDENYIQIYNTTNKKHEMVKKIALEQIEKVKIVRIRGLWAYIFYRDGNSEKKYSFPISDKEWIKTALREYKKDLEIK